MSDDYPTWVCHNCGHDAQPDKRKVHQISTYHAGICDVCGEKKPVTEPRDFGYQEFPKEDTCKLKT